MRIYFAVIQQRRLKAKEKMVVLKQGTTILEMKI